MSSTRLAILTKAATDINPNIFAKIKRKFRNKFGGDSTHPVVIMFSLILILIMLLIIYNIVTTIIIPAITPNLN